MKSTLFQIGKKLVFPQNIKRLSNSFYVTLARVLGIDEDIIEIYHDKDIELFCQDLIDITLETCRYIR